MLMLASLTPGAPYDGYLVILYLLGSYSGASLLHEIYTKNRHVIYFVQSVCRGSRLFGESVLSSSALIFCVKFDSIYEFCKVTIR